LRTQVYRVAAGVLLAVVASGVPTAQAPAAPPPLNNVLPLLEQDKPVFGLFVNYVGVGSDRESAVAHARNPDFDLLVYDLEHSAFDVSRLGEYLQWLLDRAAIARSGSITAAKTVVVRLPTNAREKNEWVIKQVLDQGVQGIVLPLTETVDQVIHAIRAMRYPQKPGAPDFEPPGLRGFSPAIAARYWGPPSAEYQQRADIWKLDAGGSLIPVFIIENQLGVQNVREIAKTLRDRRIGAILWAGRGDMTASYAGDTDAVARGLDTVLAAGKEFGIPVALNMPEDIVKRFPQGARMFVNIGPTSAPPTPEARKAVGR
jgi:4-hydroxy-2-oxoheptanedioate aldolase